MRGVAGLALVLAGCYSANPAVGVPCSGDLQCPSGQVCDTRQTPPTCVATLVDAGIDTLDAFAGCMTSSECGATSPICDQTSHVCRGCRADAECGAICTEHDGTCHADSEGLFVQSMGGDDANTCTRAQPCRHINRALGDVTATQNIVVVRNGTYTAVGSTVVDIDLPGIRVIVSGDDDNPDGVFITEIAGSTSNPAAVNITSGSDAVVEGVTVHNSDNDGIHNNGALVLYRDAIANNSSTGVFSNANNSAELHIRQCSFVNNAQEGISAQKGPVEIAQTIVAYNGSVGVFSSQSALTMTNDIIIHNGGTGSQGGLRLQNLGLVAPVLSFLTIAYNTTGNASIAGLNSDSAVAIANSILVENTSGVPGTAQICTTCTATYSLFSGTAPTGTGNIDGAPDFVDLTADDFHIQATSAAKNAADSAATVKVDVDGDKRPSGGGFDIGADEIP